MATIIEADGDGLPWGVYSVMYYAANSRGVRALAYCDSNVGARYVERLSLEPDRVAVAICNSQPGGATIYGSEAARSAWRAHLAAELRERRQQYERARRGTYSGGTWRITESASAVRFTTVDSDGQETRHAILYADLQPFARDPNAAAEPYRSLPWAAILRGAQEREPG